jgi:hypothetical protein
VLCRKTIFQTPACFWRNADSSHFWLVVPEASVMLPALTQAIQAVSPWMWTSGSAPGRRRPVSAGVSRCNGGNDDAKAWRHAPMDLILVGFAVGFGLQDDDFSA